MKKVALGLIIGLLLGMSTNGFAAVGDRVEAVFQKFNIEVNGEVAQLDTVPLVYNGTSYLPTRALANLLGYNVTYLADSETIVLTEQGDYQMMSITADTTEQELRDRLAAVERSLGINETEYAKFMEKKKERIDQGHDVPEVSDYERLAIQNMENQRLEIADLKARLGIVDEQPAE